MSATRNEYLVTNAFQELTNCNISSPNVRNIIEYDTFFAFNSLISSKNAGTMNAGVPSCAVNAAFNSLYLVRQDSYLHKEW